MNQRTLPNVSAEASVERAIDAERARLRDRLKVLVGQIAKEADLDPAEVMRKVTGYVNRKTGRPVAGKLNVHTMTEDHLDRSCQDAEAWLRRLKPMIPGGSVVMKSEAQDKDAADFWDAMLIRLSGVIAPVNFHWVRVGQGWAWKDGALVVKVPSQQHATWISSAYAQKLERAASDLGRPGLVFRFVVDQAPATLHDGAL